MESELDNFSKQVIGVINRVIKESPLANEQLSMQIAQVQSPAQTPFDRRASIRSYSTNMMGGSLVGGPLNPGQAAHGTSSIMPISSGSAQML